MALKGTKNNFSDLEIGRLVIEAHHRRSDPNLKIFLGRKGIVSVDLLKARTAIDQVVKNNPVFFDTDGMG